MLNSSDILLNQFILLLDFLLEFVYLLLQLEYYCWCVLLVLCFCIVWHFKNKDQYQIMDRSKYYLWSMVIHAVLEYFLIFGVFFIEWITVSLLILILSEQPNHFFLEYIRIQKLFQKLMCLSLESLNKKESSTYCPTNFVLSPRFS